MIAALELADLETARAVLQLQRRSYRVEAELIGYDAIPPLLEELGALQACGESFHGLRIGERLAAAIAFKRLGALLDIHRLMVDPDFFRAGLGRRLVRFATELPGVERLVVSTGALNLPARRLYESEGFRLAAETTLDDGLRLARYEKALG